MLEKIARLDLRVRHYIGGQAVFDSFLWPSVVVIAVVLRYDFNLKMVTLLPLVIFGALVGVVSFIAGKFLSLYRSRHKTASLSELLSLLLATALTSLAAMSWTLVWGPFWGIPRSTIVIAAPLFLLFAGGIRVVRRLLKTKVIGSKNGKPTIVYGAGEIAEILIPQLLADSNARFRPIGLVDDDPEKFNRWISGVKMKGLGSNLESVLMTSRAKALIVAVPRANSDFFRKIEAVAGPLGVEVLVLPNLTDMLQRPGKTLEMHNIGIEDLIGRRAVDTNISQIGSYLADKRVLITGAGGSIGVELCRQVSLFHPKQLMFLDRDETGLQLAQLVTSRTGLLDNSDYLLADIRDGDLIGEMFLHKKPDVVLHAAALKHLPVLEKFPSEAWKTNVLGTLNVLSAAHAAGVDTFINISTDKASDPSSVLGRSKRTAEQLTSWFATKHARNYVSVRFGNVLGSRGSLVPTLAHMINAGAPVEITHPDATRFFMTIPEACQLVLQAGALGEGSEVFVLDMGTPVKILDIAKKMIQLSGKDIEIVFSGLRPGEKLHEELFSSGELLRESRHELIFRVKSKSLDPKDLKKLEKSFVQKATEFP